MTRRNFSFKVKAAAFERAKGRCEECTARLSPGNIEYDHILADGLTGEPTLENCAVVCKTCHGIKTRKHDMPLIWKADRIRKKHIGAKPKRPWNTRYRKKMDGSVVER